MPNRDQTGPEGKGKLTGRGMGPCTDEEKKVLRDKLCRPEFGRGRGGPGRGLDKGRGLGRRSTDN